MWIFHPCTSRDPLQASRGSKHNLGAGVEGFWEALQQGQTLQRCMPLDRWDVDAQYDPEGSAGSSYTRFGTFAADVDLHDAAFFRLSRTEASSTDPQTRLLLQVGLCCT